MLSEHKDKDWFTRAISVKFVGRYGVVIIKMFYIYKGQVNETVQNIIPYNFYFACLVSRSARINHREEGRGMTQPTWAWLRTGVTESAT